METLTTVQQSNNSRRRTNNRRRRAAVSDRPDDATTPQDSDSRSATSTRPPHGPQSERNTRQEGTQNTENRGPIRQKPPRRKAGGSRTDPHVQRDQPSASVTSTAEADSGAHGDLSQACNQPRPRRRAFNPKLTEPPEPQAAPESSSGPRRRTGKSLDSPADADLTSTLTRALRTPPYPDCLICFSPIRPEHPTWSCSSSVPLLHVSVGPDDPDKERSQCCWTTFHLKCIRTWADKSVKSLVEAWRARGEERPGEWRCPGCQTKREQVPTTYQCFCHRTSNPSPPRISTPHSCGLPCSRTRSSGCGHPCPLPCHPGPCPPCGITVQRPCFCGRVVRSAKCSTSGNAGSSDGLQRGFFSCMNTCAQPLSCKNPTHKCELPCHADPCPPCPVKQEARCWCGSETKVVACGELSSEDATKCVILKRTAPDGPEEEETWIGQFGCGKACNRHVILRREHPPPCPYDPISVTRCGCGRDDTSPVLPPPTSCTSPPPVCSAPCSKPLPCEILCNRPCPALRSCGRHQCGRICCPLASLATKKGKKKARSDCHGPCGVCLRSIFDEITCSCNRMVFEPPIPCGTSEPPCGHRQVPHACHESTIVAGADTCRRGATLPLWRLVPPSQCPPCPFLTRRFVLCGPCTLVCGKSRKACLPEHHPCTEICHAPTACPETGPCLAMVTLTCPCGNLRSTVPCSNRKQCLACSGDCEVKKRKEKLAEAFGISKEKREAIAAGPKVTWNDELIDYVTANAKFVRLMEDTLADFVKSSRRTQVLQHMPAERRKFVQGLASVYRMDTTEVDQEPHRSVQLIRRIDTRIPVPPLSQCAVSAAPPSKLVDLRSSKAQVQREQPAAVAREDVPQDWEDDI
ncbi:hypothetical protein EDC04DRAFT_2866044 [Pisolithus marmoratus]|nr:hypothetical protein EDC04DRAFT_2866044 [Pisolithus marmoratus]